MSLCGLKIRWKNSIIKVYIFYIILFVEYNILLKLELKIYNCKRQVLFLKCLTAF